MKLVAKTQTDERYRFYGLMFVHGTITKDEVKNMVIDNFATKLFNIIKNNYDEVKHDLFSVDLYNDFLDLNLLPKNEFNSNEFDSVIEYEMSEDIDVICERITNEFCSFGFNDMTPDVSRKLFGIGEFPFIHVYIGRIEGNDTTLIGYSLYR